MFRLYIVTLFISCSKLEVMYSHTELLGYQLSCQVCSDFWQHICVCNSMTATEMSCCDCNMNTLARFSHCVRVTPSHMLSGQLDNTQCYQVQ